MLRYSFLILSAFLAITTAASAQVVFSVGIGGNNNGRFQNGRYVDAYDYQYNQQQCPPQGNYGYNQGPPPGHYFCNTHNEYCSHGRQAVRFNNNNRRFRKRQKQRRRASRRARRNNNYGSYQNVQQCPPPRRW